MTFRTLSLNTDFTMNKFFLLIIFQTSPFKKLAIFGSKAAVPALAPLLADKDLASWARIALEAIPGPEADEVLRKAVGALKGNLLIGTINSIAVRRDAKAVDLLVGKLKDTDAEVASAKR